jgi:hypothetical protein
MRKTSPDELWALPAEPIDLLHKSEKLTISDFGFWIEGFRTFARGLSLVDRKDLKVS